MALRGPSPLSQKLGRTPNADWTDVPNIPFEGPSPDLPKLPRRRKWHPLVELWWADVRQMPHCRLWMPTDWHFAVETALMKQAFFTLADEGVMTITAATEIRRREDQMGTTNEARRKLRIRYVDVAVEDEVDEPVADEQPTVVHQPRAGGARPVTSLESRRARARQAQRADDQTA